MKKQFEIPRRPLIGYLSYPFSGNPRLNTKIACGIAKKIMMDHPNLFLIVPHSAVDYTLYGPPREKISDYGERDHTIAAKLEFTIISCIDVFIQGVPDDPTVSMGCIWEHSFGEWINEVQVLRDTLGKKELIVVSLREILSEVEINAITDKCKREYELENK